MNIFTCRVDLEVDRLLRRTMLDRAASPLFLSSSKGLLDPPCAARTLAQLASGGTILATEFSGGVAERLNAPVLKTGRPKGLLSSNLPPSALLPSRRLLSCAP